MLYKIHDRIKVIKNEYIEEIPLESVGKIVRIAPSGPASLTVEFDAFSAPMVLFTDEVTRAGAHIP